MRFLAFFLLALPAIFCPLAGKTQSSRDSILRHLAMEHKRPTYWEIDTAGYASLFALDEDTVKILIRCPRKRLKPIPLVLFQHWGPGNCFEFQGEMDSLANLGFFCVSFDAPWLWRGYDTAQNGLRAYPDNILLSCRAISSYLDYAVTTGYIDPARIYFVGHSYGATLAGPLLASDPRIKAAILMAGLPSISASMEEDPFGHWKSTKETARPLYDSVRYRLSLMEPQDLIGRSKARIYYQAALRDEAVSRDFSERYISIAKPVTVKWYDTTHRFENTEAQRDRIAWILAECRPVKNALHDSKKRKPRQ